MKNKYDEFVIFYSFEGVNGFDQKQQTLSTTN